MGYMFRYFPAFLFLFDALREGWLGRVFEVHGVMSEKNSREERLELSAFPGGAMFVEGCHLIDLLVIALGEPDNIEAFARRTRPELDAAVDNQLAVFEYPKTTATIRSAVVEADDGRHRRRQFVVCGDEGTIEIRPLQPSKLLLTLERPRGSYEKCSQLEVSLPALAGPYDDQLLDLARIVRGEKEADLLPSHDLAVHECVLRASGLPLS
jgi:predicted dehydrogenase